MSGNKVGCMEMEDWNPFLQRIHDLKVTTLIPVLRCSWDASSCVLGGLISLQNINVIETSDL